MAQALRDASTPCPALLEYFFFFCMTIYIFKTNAIGLLHINKRDQPVKFAVRVTKEKKKEIGISIDACLA